MLFSDKFNFYKIFCPSTGCVTLNVLLYNHGFPWYNFQLALVIIMSDVSKS